MLSTAAALGLAVVLVASTKKTEVSPSHFVADEKALAQEMKKLEHARCVRAPVHGPKTCLRVVPGKKGTAEAKYFGAGNSFPANAMAGTGCEPAPCATNGAQ